MALDIIVKRVCRGSKKDYKVQGVSMNVCESRGTLCKIVKVRKVREITEGRLDIKESSINYTN